MDRLADDMNGHRGADATRIGVVISAEDDEIITGGNPVVRGVWAITKASAVTKIPLVRGGVSGNRADEVDGEPCGEIGVGGVESDGEWASGTVEFVVRQP